MAAPERLLDFYVDNAIKYVCFNIEEQEGLNSQSNLVGSKAPDLQYRDFSLERFLHLNVQRNQPVLVREVENSMRSIEYHGREICNQQSEPFGIVSVDCEGNVSTFSPELLGLQHERYGSFSFGNLLQDNFEEIARRIDESKLYADIQLGVKQMRRNVRLLWSVWRWCSRKQDL